MKLFLHFGILSIFLISCSSSSVKEKINKAGDIAGQASGEFAKGIGNGVSKAFDVKIDLPQSLSDKGIKFGKTTISSDSIGTDNLLSIYFIFEKNFSGKITAKVFDNKGQEMGRAVGFAEGKENETKFIDFHFDKRTNIDSDCKITIE